MTGKKKVIIVESPAKAKTIEGILGEGYKVLASYGHIRDLPKSEFGVDLKTFKPQFVVIPGKGKVIEKLKREVDGREVLLASDMDREGEAIAWHVSEVLSLPKERVRITFTEITPGAIKKALENVRDIDMKLVSSQFARRILDRIVGYKISPLLWRIFRINNLSAGRVQSAVLKIVCEREREIHTFVPKEFWRVRARVGEDIFELTHYKGKRVDKDLPDEAIEALKSITELRVGSVKVKVVEKKPPEPFTTSTLQQAAASQLHFSVKKTMAIAQQLYEGVDTREGHMAFITYHRTDSTRVSDEAREMAKNFIEESFGKEYVGSYRRKRTKRKIQDAHEAIRPVNLSITPERARELLNEDQHRLYELIWKRFLASQMSPSKREEIRVELESVNGEFIFSAKFSRRIFDGFEKVLPREEKITSVEYSTGKILNVSVEVYKDRTKPPERFSEGTLVKEMERLGIGRPSTYAPTISTLLSRKYVVKKKGKLHPTLLGFLVLDYLEKYFPEIVDVEFTAKMEEKLDLVESGDREHVEILEEFFVKFNENLEKARNSFHRVDYVTNFECGCGEKMRLATGRYGIYLKCPKCGKTRSVKPDYTAILNDGEVIFPWLGEGSRSESGDDVV